jgi:hypothetical protein
MQLEIAVQRFQEQEEMSLEMKNAANTMEGEFRHSIELNQEKQENQIRYLKQHLKNVVDEFAKSQDSGDFIKIGNFEWTSAFKETMRKDIDASTNEILGIREVIRNKAHECDALVNQKISEFDEFRLLVLDNLITWDEKSAELAQIMGQYYDIFETQCNYLTRLKKTVWKKDDLLNHLQ